MAKKKKCGGLKPGFAFAAIVCKYLLASGSLKRAFKDKLGGNMSQSVRWKEIRVRQEIYKEILKQTNASSEAGDSNDAEGIRRDKTALEIGDFDRK